MNWKKTAAATLKPATARRRPRPPPPRAKHLSPVKFVRPRRSGFLPGLQFFRLKSCPRISVRRRRLPACRRIGWKPAESVLRPPVLLPAAGCQPGLKMSRKINAAVTIKPAMAQRLSPRTKSSGPAKFFRSRWPGFLPVRQFFGLKSCPRISVRRRRLPAGRRIDWKPAESVLRQPVFLPAARCQPALKMSRKKNGAVTIKPAMAQRLPSRAKLSGPAKFFRSRWPGFLPDLQFFGLKFCSRIFVRQRKLPTCWLADRKPAESVPPPPVFLPAARC